MIEKTSKDHYKTHNDESLKSLEMYQDINDRVEHEVEDLSTSLDSVIGRVDYKIENYQLQFYGFTLNMEFLFEFVAIVASLVVGII